MPLDLSLWLLRWGLRAWHQHWPVRLDGELLSCGRYQCLQFVLATTRAGTHALELRGVGRLAHEDFRATGLLGVLGADPPALGLHLVAPNWRATLVTRRVPQLYWGIPAGTEFRGRWQPTVGLPGIATLRIDYRTHVSCILHSTRVQ